MTREEINMRHKAAKIIAWIFSCIAILLIIASFVLPPLGVVDNSVLGACGEIFAFVALFMAWEAIDRGIDAKVTHKDTTIELNNPDNKNE